MLRDDSAERNKERNLLGKVLASKVIKRGGLTKIRAGTYPDFQCLKLPQIVPFLLTDTATKRLPKPGTLT